MFELLLSALLNRSELPRVTGIFNNPNKLLNNKMKGANVECVYRKTYWHEKKKVRTN